VHDPRRRIRPRFRRTRPFGPGGESEIGQGLGERSVRRPNGQTRPCAKGSGRGGIAPVVCKCAFLPAPIPSLVEPRRGGFAQRSAKRGHIGAFGTAPVSQAPALRCAKPPRRGFTVPAVAGPAVFHARHLAQLVTPNCNVSRGNSGKNERDDQPCGACWPSLYSLGMSFEYKDLRLVAERLG